MHRQSDGDRPPGDKLVERPRHDVELGHHLSDRYLRSVCRNEVISAASRFDILPDKQIQSSCVDIISHFLAPLFEKRPFSHNWRDAHYH